MNVLILTHKKGEKSEHVCFLITIILCYYLVNNYLEGILMHYKVKKQKYFIALLVLIMLMTLVLPVMAKESNTPPKQQSIGTINASSQLSFELTDMHMLPSNTSNIVSYTLAIHNKSNSEVPFIDYWVRLKSKSGATYTTHIVQNDRETTRIAAQSTESITFYSTVGSEVNLQDLSVSIVAWDFTVPNYERTLGQIQIPANYSPFTPHSSSKVIQIANSNVEAKIKTSNASATDLAYIASFSLEFNNIGNFSVDLPNYSYFIMTEEGITYPLDIINPNDDKRLQPRFSKSVQLQGTIPLGLGNKGWKLYVAEVQNSDIVVPVAAFNIEILSEEDLQTVAIGETKELLINNTTVGTKVERFIRNKNDQFYVATVNLSFENTGLVSVNVPNYNFAIRTSENLTYPISRIDNSDLTIDPKVKKEIQMNVSIPIEVDEKDWKLLLSMPSVGDHNNNFNHQVLAMYLLPDTPSQSSTVGSQYRHINESGEYLYTFNGVQRLPWDDQDIISVRINIENPGNQSKVLPQLGGYILLDDAIRIPVDAVELANTIGIRGNGSVDVHMYGFIPYNFDYSKLQLVLQEKDKESQLNNITDFVVGSEIIPLENISSNQAYAITNPGKNSSISINSVNTYSSPDGNIFTVLIDVRNLEKRFTNISNLVGYIQTSDDLMFPIEISQINEKIAPLSRATLYAWTKLPSNYGTDNLKLILGEGISNNSIVDGAATPNAYINVVSFSLPAEKTAHSSSLNDLALFPYTVSLSRLRTEVNTTESAIFSFNYELTKNQFVTVGQEQHQLVIEFSDPASGLSFSKEFTLDQAEGDSNLELGKDSAYVIIDDPVIMHKLQVLDRYTVKVYDQFLNQKKLLAEQELRWFSTSN